MGAVPKHKVSRHYRGNRRRHIFLDAPTLVPCQTCGLLHRAHHVCKNCGSYNNRQVIEIRGKTADDE